MPSSQSAHWLLSLSLGYANGAARRCGLRGSAWTVAGTRCCLGALQAQSQSAAMSTSPSEVPKLKKVLVANRGEIACRVLTTARKMGIASVAVFSEADRLSKHVELADESYCIGGAAARDSYLRADVILDVARRTGADAVHPGYGFLSENAAFAEACAAAGIAFVGPPAAAIRAMGDKSTAKALMQAAGVPVVPGYHGEDQSEERLLSESGRIGFPLLVKAVCGGGGKGMKLAAGPGELRGAIGSARREALSSFADGRLLLERYVAAPRHVEVQVFADSYGGAVYLYDRDCSLQRRHQKVIEEAPAPGLSAQLHTQLGEAAVRAARAVGYVGAGTVEFLLDTEIAVAGGQQQFYFMEMNTRLQVEHPITEAITGIDLVSWQLGVAAGQRLPATQAQLRGPAGHAVEARVYAEDPRNGFLPGAGRVRRWRTPPAAVAFQGGEVRVDSGVRQGDTVGSFYDPLIAKVVVHAGERAAALQGLERALGETQVAGLPTNIPFLRRLAAHPSFAAAERGELTTAFIARHREELLRPQAVPQEVAALAAVARHMLTVRRRALAESAQGLTGRLGPWAAAAAATATTTTATAANPGSSVLSTAAAASSVPVPGSGALDSGRLWHAHRRTYVVRHPEGGEGASLGLSLTVLGGGDFLVEMQQLGQQQQGQLQQQSGAGAVAAAATATAPPISVRCARLVPEGGAERNKADGGSGSGGSGSGDLVLTAEVNGRRCTAQVLMYGGAADEDEEEGGGGGGVGGGGAVAAESCLDLWAGGEHFHFTWPEPIWSRKMGASSSSPGAAGPGACAGAGAGAVVAPMPGRVVAVMVAEGDRVEAGTPLVALEAMKMEHAVVAARGGVVRQVEVGAGAQVAQGQLLVRLEVEPEEGEAKEGKKK